MNRINGLRDRVLGFIGVVDDFVDLIHFGGFPLDDTIEALGIVLSLMYQTVISAGLSGRGDRAVRTIESVTGDVDFGCHL